MIKLNAEDLENMSTEMADKVIRRRRRVPALQLRNPMPALRTSITNWFGAKAEQATLAFLGWALHKRSVQELIADRFKGGGPLCHALNEAVQHNMDGIEIDADNVHNLERYVSECFENFEIDANNVSGLDKFVEDMLENIEVSADNVSGLEDAVREQLSEDEELQKELTATVMKIITKKFRED